MPRATKDFFPGGNPVAVEGERVTLDGEEFYRITNSDRLRPFLISIVSSGDHWMFISSNGALTAGRRNPDCALFPYYTDDKIHDAVETTGPETIIIAEAGAKEFLWEPFLRAGTRQLSNPTQSVQELRWQSDRVRGNQQRCRFDLSV